MYTQLLGMALGRRSGPDGGTARAAAFAELLRSRGRLSASPTAVAGHGDLPDAVADQLRYDVALIEVSRLFGIECDVTRFDHPESERARLELELMSRGVRFDDQRDSDPR